MEEVIKVSKKGQITIPKELRDKYVVQNKILIVEDEKGLLIKRLPSPNNELAR
jgi:looped-hinge helix DNA binding domain, AbrB family